MKDITNDINKNYRKQSFKTRVARFARIERDPNKKQRILEVGENYYDDSYINEWAKTFKNDIGRRPTKKDFEEYFGRKFPRKSLNRNFDKSLFNLWDSYFELKVCDYINSIGYIEKRTVNDCISKIDYVRNSMFTLNKKKYYQIDIYFPLLDLGFEIQDFTTHSKNSDLEPYAQRAGVFKHGPSYHNEKRDAALQIGITIVEIWEDEIKNNEYKNIINKLLCQLI